MYGFSIDPSNSEQLVGAFILFFIAGAIILALSRFFAYGVELQKDTEGLV